MYFIDVKYFVHTKPPIAFTIQDFFFEKSFFNALTFNDLEAYAELCDDYAASQLHSALRGLILLDIRIPLQWERVVELKFGPRLQECSHCLYLEIMGKYGLDILIALEMRLVLALYSGCQPFSSSPA